MMLLQPSAQRHFVVLNDNDHWKLLHRCEVHAFVKHAEYYVDGAVHTNGIENFWALLKRMIKGTYVSVEPFHMFRYLNEEAFRFNERFGNDGDRFETVVKQIINKRLTFDQLTGKQESPTCGF